MCRISHVGLHMWIHLLYTRIQVLPDSDGILFNDKNDNKNKLFAICDVFVSTQMSSDTFVSKYLYCLMQLINQHV